MSTTRCLCILWITLVGAGCATEPAPAPTLADWKRDVERYVWEQGNGDPSILRDATWDDVHPGFAILGDPLPERSVDVMGLLLDHRRIDGRPYFVFMVALVHNGAVDDLRPVALNVAGGSFRWWEGPSTTADIARYRDSRDPESPGAFPDAEDTFRVEDEPGGFAIAHEPSGVVWRVGVGQGPPG